MDTDVESLQDLLKISFDVFESSRNEAQTVLDMYHNRQYTDSELAVLANRGQPAETFNIIKLMGRLILGYYSTVVNTIKVSPKQFNDIDTAGLLNDTLVVVMEDNQFETEGDKIKLDGILTGLMCVYENVEDTDEKDMFGRKIRRVTLEHVPEREILIDPMSTKEDYSDARYIHRWKWIREETLIKMLKDMGVKDAKAKVEALDAYHNHLNIDHAEFETVVGNQFDGYFKRYNNYLLVHTIIEDDDGKVWSIYWSGDQELSKKEVTYREVKFPYRVHKIHTSDKVEYYGLFREVIESQRSINQALLKIQLMVNTQKAFVEKGGVEDLTKFTDAFNRVNAVIPVLNLAKIKIETLNKEILDQYTIIDKAFDRVKLVLGVTDAFLGMAFASDSGRKVKLQQNSTTISLRYVSVRIEQFYRLLGWDIVNLIKQYYTAYQVLRIADETTGQRWFELNRPLELWNGKFNPDGTPVMELVWEEVLYPASGKPMEDEQGNIIVAPVPRYDTEIAFTKVDISIDSVIYNDEDEKNQLMLETILQGNIGAHLAQVYPAGYFKAASLAVRSMKSRHSRDISEILGMAASIMDNTGAAMPPKDGANESQMSGSLKLPQNTNEGV